MMSSYVTLAPSNLVQPPVCWTALEVKAWLEFCIQEFALNHVRLDKFDMNGKALLLLTRADFMERSPRAGDVLFNAFQHLRYKDNVKHGQAQIQNITSSYIPILPQPISTVSSSTNNSQNVTNNKITQSRSGKRSPSVPASSSAVFDDNNQQDADSSQIENRLSSHSTDHEMDSDDGRRYDSSCSRDDGANRLLWEFLYQLLEDATWSHVISWETLDDFTFCIKNPQALADAWGKHKNRSNMTYEKLSRALRYYYRQKILKKVAAKPLTYQFLQHPSTIQKCQRGAKPRSRRNLSSEATETGLLIPDSSTHLATSSSSTISSPSTTSSPNAVRQLSNEPSSTEGSPVQNHNLIESPGTLSLRSSCEQHVSQSNVVSFLPDSLPKTYFHQQRSILPYDVPHTKTSIAEMNMDTTLSVPQIIQSQGKTFLDVPLKYCCTEKVINYRSQNSVCCKDDSVSKRSQTSCMVMGVGQKSALFQNQSAPGFSTTNNYWHTDNSHLSLSAMDQQPPSLNNCDQSVQNKPVQDSNQIMNFREFTPPLSPTYRQSSVPLTSRNLTTFPSRAEEKPQNKIYCKPSVIPSPSYHPYSPPLLIDCTSQARDFGELQRYHNSPLLYCHRDQQQLRNELPIGHLRASGLAGFDQHVKKNTLDHNCFNQELQNLKNACNVSEPIIQERYKPVQSEPEDLSMKFCPKENHSDTSNIFNSRPGACPERVYRFAT